MAIERTDSAPLGLAIPTAESLIGLTPEDPGTTMNLLDDGGVEFIFTEEEEVNPAINAPFEANLADYLDEDTLQEIGNEIIELIDIDINSRKEWVAQYVQGMEVLGLKHEEVTQPWKGASNAFSSLLLESVTRFQAETMMETFPAMGPVRTKILGEETKETTEAAKRVEVDMNYELTEVMEEYRTEHEKMLFSLGLAGSTFKKIYFDPNRGRQVSKFCPAEEVIVPWGASTLQDAERVTQLLRLTKNELAKAQMSGMYTDVDLGEPEAFNTDVEEKKAELTGYELNEDDRYAFYEVHIEYVIEALEDSVSVSSDPDDDRRVGCPYVITIDRGTNNVIGIRRNWTEGDPVKKKKQYFVHYGYLPAMGFYNLGLIHLVGGYSRAGSEILRELIDAGELANLQGGFKTADLRIENDDTPIAAGEWKDVDVPMGTLRDNLMALPYKEPSATLLALMDKLMDEGRRLGSISDLGISDMSANAPVGTTLALLERALKSMSAVQARVHYAMKQEFKLLHALIKRYAPEEYGYVPERAEMRARKADYDLVEVIPVSDPNSSTMAQRVVQYQAVHQLSTTAQQIYNLPQLHRQMIEVLGVPNAEKLVPTEDDALPMDPVSENMDALVGKPLKAFLNQDHQAHLAAHAAFMQDPMIMQAIGQNPMAQQIMGSLQAHMAEHVAFNYRKQMEERLGAPLPAPGKPLPDEIEVELSRAIAQAGKELSDRHKQEAARKEAEQIAKDPVQQLKEKEAAIREREVVRKERKDVMDKDTKELEIAADLLDKDKNRAISVQEGQKDRRAKAIEQKTGLEGQVRTEIMKKALEPKTPTNNGNS